MEDLDVETWDTVEYEDDPIQRRSVTIDGVTAVSVPGDSTGRIRISPDGRFSSA